MYKIVDYTNCTVADGFPTRELAYRYLWSTYTKDFIDNMNFRIVRYEEDNNHG